MKPVRYIDEIRQIKQKNVYEDINKIVKEVFSYMDDERFALDKKTKIWKKKKYFRLANLMSL